MRAVLVLLLLATSSVAMAKDRKDAPKDGKDAKTQPAPPPPRTPGPEDGKATALLDKIVAGTDRKAAIEQLGHVAPRTVDAIGEWLARPHTSDVADRRNVLAEIHASVPDKTGKFSTPARQDRKEAKADDELDWLEALGKLDPAMPGLGEVIGDVAAIRALAGTNDVHAARLIFDAAFGDDTMIYRDECGRYLRKMEPNSIPALIYMSQKGNYDKKRYATWQLERLDRQNAYNALLAAAGDEALTIAILEVYRTTHHREAVHAVWSKVNDDAPRVRATARAAWMDYITGPPPPPAPKKKLQLPGGKLTKEEKPLWLTYRELADNELRKAANELLHEDYPLDDPTLDDFDHKVRTVKVDLVELTKRLFDYYDTERAKQDSAQWLAAKVKADAGDLAGATAMLDRLLAANAERGERDLMAKVYFAWAKQLEAKQQWAEAAVAYSKAQGLDPKGAEATAALAAHHYTLGKALEAQGKDGGPDFRKAVALKPDYAPAKTEAARIEAARRPVWMLYTAIIAALAAMALFGVAMMRRRA